MYIVGILIYVAVTLLLTLVEAARDFILQSFALSPEITTLIGIAYLYPIVIFVVSITFKRKTFSNVRYFKSQVILASTLAVSFGLIGTFIGLAEMIASIAAGMGADGDFATKMAALLAAIGTALDSMSLAFLTSILGVGASIVILFASNYLSTYFAEDDFRQKELKNAGAADADEAGILVDGKVSLAEGFETVKEHVQNTLNLVADKEQTWSDLHLLLQKNTGSTLSENLSNTLVANNELMQKNNEMMGRVADEMVSLRTEQSNAMSDMANKVGTSLDGVTHVVSSLFSQLESTSESTTKIMSESTEQLIKLAGMLQDIRVATSLPLDELLKQALRQNSFELFYQPQVNTKGLIIGCESYIRWDDPIRGVVSNFDLFNLAEEAGMLVAIDRWVLEAAVKQASDWKKDSLLKDSFVMTVNVTDKQLIDPGFVTFIVGLLAKYDVKPENIAIDITEQTIMDHPEACLDKLRQIKTMGIIVNIDDFGTGFSSIRTLKALSIDNLKVGRQIISGAANGDQEIISSIVDLAKTLSISISAEGIEVKDSLASLINMGFSAFQGYYFGKPVSAADFADKMLKRKKTINKAP